ncbi:TrmH family RNA methyltransferase [Ilumatobacter sp.]|uniref:TrmH family RNA methyltransferase n=1 Tax=Ilumatobacter sp. TaxID=1967498 RepID=UPI003C39C4CC
MTAALSPVGVGPHPQPWPDDPRLDPALLADGDRRNVIDRYRYWSVDAIVTDLDERRHGFHVAIENWEHDFNIGTVVRNANAFLAAEVHIIGPHRWDRRGAMSTHRYLSLRHHADVEAFRAWTDAEEIAIVAIDNVDGAAPIESTELPRDCALVFGQEGPGLTDAMLDAADLVCAITQYGSTRSLNAGVASGIAMYAWVNRHGRGT